MTTYRLQCSLQDSDTLARDRYVSSFYTNFVGDATDAQLDASLNAVQDFYMTGTSQGNPPDKAVKVYMAAVCQGGISTIKAYKVDTAPSHTPLRGITFDLGAFPDAARNLPNELACVLSINADRLAFPGVPVGRLRGRIYVGPLNDLAIQTDQDIKKPAMVSGLLMQYMQRAANRLHVALKAAGGGWCIFSPTALKAGDPVPYHYVDQTHVDNAFDIQRRRGVRATNRVSQVLAP